MAIVRKKTLPCVKIERQPLWVFAKIKKIALILQLIVYSNQLLVNTAVLPTTAAVCTKTSLPQKIIIKCYRFPLVLCWPIQVKDGLPVGEKKNGGKPGPTCALHPAGVLSLPLADCELSALNAGAKKANSLWAPFRGTTHAHSLCGASATRLLRSIPGSGVHACTNGFVVHINQFNVGERMGAPRTQGSLVSVSVTHWMLRVSSCLSLTNLRWNADYLALTCHIQHACTVYVTNLSHKRASF